MNIQEMTTASYYGINVKVLIMNNSVLGMVHQWQNLFYDERYSETILPDLPDFVKVAKRTTGRPNVLRSLKIWKAR